MTQEVSPQKNLEGQGFVLTPDMVLKNREVVTDFFGDNRKWYKELMKGGATYGRVRLGTQQELNEEEEVEAENLPLDPSLINDGRANNIAIFFVLHPQALADFLEYSKWYTKDSAADETAS